jgi:hypothetical protein
MTRVPQMSSKHLTTLFGKCVLHMRSPPRNGWPFSPPYETFRSRRSVFCGLVSGKPASAFYPLVLILREAPRGKIDWRIRNLVQTRSGFIL